VQTPAQRLAVIGSWLMSLAGRIVLSIYFEVASKMSCAIPKAIATFEQAIQDAEHLLAHFDKLNAKPPPPENEVLKRAGLILAMTAWETFVEDSLEELLEHRLKNCSDPAIAELVRSKLRQEISRLHNPTAERATELFQDYAGVDVSTYWQWNGVDAESARTRLNDYLKLRGDVAHRARVVRQGPPQRHAVKREDLDRVIRFLKQLVKATDSALVPIVR
jgi:RiboL-PSP-HEPN